jgi:hypothetical protein|tara:strand:+ start:286 stop:843 length:558 start_codon:yes stop_codon:yes gene_type:complete
VTIKVNVGGAEENLQPSVEKDSPVVTSFKMKARRAINGDIMVFDHADVDIVLSPTTSKIVAFSKEAMSDLVYGAQDRLFSFLSKKGIVDRASVQSGNVYGSMEGTILPGVDRDSFRMALINLSKWVDEERPYFEFAEKFGELMVDRFTDPDEEASTELGEVPHDLTKGALRPGYNYGPYWQNYTL